MRVYVVQVHVHVRSVLDEIRKVQEDEKLDENEEDIYGTGWSVAGGDAGGAR